MPGLCAIVPIKRLADAKQRLAPALARHERAALMAAMAADTIEAVVSVLGRDGLVVVAADTMGIQFANTFGVSVIDDLSNAGQSAAVAQAIPGVLRRGLGAVLVLPADIPLATASEISFVAQSVLADSWNPSIGTMTIVSSRDGDGSNAVAVAPPKALRFQFGPGSYRRHLETAVCEGLRVHEFDLPGIALDIDTPDDLAELIRRPGRGRTHAYLSSLGLERRLGPPAPHRMVAL